MDKKLTHKQWIVLAKYVTHEKLSKQEQAVLKSILEYENYCQLIYSVNTIFRTSPLSDLNVENSLRQLTDRIEND
ncbi:MAG: hypothetical protein AAGA64_08475 [Bacteroidota bacterium]